MKVELDKTFAMPASVDTTWSLLQDIESVAACMPGASITERIDAQHYKGTVAVRFGPANMAFRGTVEVAALDAPATTLRLIGKGTDTTGSSGASMDLTARLEAIDDASCNLMGHSEVSMSGKAATFGGRMAGAVADQVLKQFADNFAARVRALQEAQVAAAPAAPVVAAPPAQSQAAGPTAPPAPAPTSLNGLALAWAVLSEWLRSLFAAKRT
ncbi:MAG: SRPBCC family protein [Variovorax sp.]